MLPIVVLLLYLLFYRVFSNIVPRCLIQVMLRGQFATTTIFSAKKRSAMLKQCSKHSKQYCNNVATLYCAKNRRCELSRVTSLLKNVRSFVKFLGLLQVDLLASGASLVWPRSGRPRATKSREVDLRPAPYEIRRRTFGKSIKFRKTTLPGSIVKSSPIYED